MGTGGAPTELGTTQNSRAVESSGPAGGITGFVSRLSRDEHGRADADHASHPVATSNPALALAVLTCMDARLDLGTGLGIKIGDAHILRNAGGRVTPDVIRSLHLSVSLMNVREIGILHHTNCALWGTDNDTLARRTQVFDIDFLPFKSVKESLSRDVTQVLRAGILPPGGLVWGAVYSLHAGQITVVRGPVRVARQGRAGPTRSADGDRPPEVEVADLPSKSTAD